LAVSRLEKRIYIIAWKEKKARLTNVIEEETVVVLSY
jgi:hypothetical protein